MQYHGAIVTDGYGRQIPKHVHGTINLNDYTASTEKILSAVSTVFDRIVDKTLLVRRLNLTANHVIPETSVSEKNAGYEQLVLFMDYTVKQAEQEKEQHRLERERSMQKTLLTIKRKFGKNAILRGMNLEEGATGKDRNAQIGGHRA